MRHCLVTGGAGFIGSHLVDALIRSNCKVTVVDNLSTGSYTNLNEKSTFHHLDVLDSRLDSVFDGNQIDYVFHLAAQINLRHSIEDFKHDANINILGSLNLIDCAIRHKVKKFIFSSTGGAIYTPTSQLFLPSREHSETMPQSPYGLSKLTIENYLKIMKNLKGLDSVALRYSNVFGPRQISKSEAGVISIFTNAALRNHDLNIFGDGAQTRDLVYCADVVQANILAMEKETSMPAYNVSSNSQTSVSHLAKMIINKTNSTSKIINQPPVSGEVRHTQLSYNAFQKETGWKPNVTLEQGINKTIEWFKLQS